MTDTSSKPRVLLSILKGESFEHLPDAETLFTAISAGYGRFECERLLKPSGVELMNLPASAGIEICVLQKDRETGQKHLRYHGLVPLASVHPAFFNATGGTGVPPAPGVEGGLASAGKDTASIWESWLGLFSADVDLKKAQSPDRVFQQCLEMGSSRAGFPRLFLRLQYLPPGTSAVPVRGSNVRGASRPRTDVDASPIAAAVPTAMLGAGGATPSSRAGPPDLYLSAPQALSRQSTPQNGEAAAVVGFGSLSTPGAEEMNRTAAVSAGGPGTNSQLGQYQWQAGDLRPQAPGSEVVQSSTGLSAAAGYPPSGRGNGEAPPFVSSNGFSSSARPSSKDRMSFQGGGSQTPVMGVGVNSQRSPPRQHIGTHPLPPTAGDAAAAAATAAAAAAAPSWLHGRMPLSNRGMSPSGGMPGPARATSPGGGKSPYRSHRSPDPPQSRPFPMQARAGSPVALPRFQSGSVLQAEQDATPSAEVGELRQRNEELAVALKDLELRSQQRASETYELRQLVAELRAQTVELERENLRLHQSDLARESVERDFFEQISPALTSLGFQQRATPAEMASSMDVARGHFAQIVTALADSATRKQTVRSDDTRAEVSAGNNSLADLAEEGIAQAVTGGEPAFEEWFKNSAAREKLVGSERLVKSCREAAALKSALGKESSAVLGSYFYTPVKSDPVDLLIAARFLRLGAEWPTMASAAAGLTRLDTGKYSLGPHGPTISCHIDQGHVMVQPPNGGELGNQGAVELGAFLAARAGNQRPNAP